MMRRNGVTDERMMAGKRPHGLGHRLEALARTITRFAGSTMGFALALGTIVVWVPEQGLAGPPAQAERDRGRTGWAEQSSGQHRGSHGSGDGCSSWSLCKARDDGESETLT